MSSNLPDYLRSELANCQNLKEVTTLVAVCRYLGVVRARELGYTQTKIATQLGISKQKVSRIQLNTMLVEKGSK